MHRPEEVMRSAWSTIPVDALELFPEEQVVAAIAADLVSDKDDKVYPSSTLLQVATVNSNRIRREGKPVFVNDDGQLVDPEDLWPSSEPLHRCFFQWSLTNA